LRAFAVTQIAASFVLLAGAGVVVRTLVVLQRTEPAFETARVLTVNVPVMSFGRTRDQIRGFYREVQRRIAELPGVERVAIGSTTPWRDARGPGFALAFSVEGRVSQNAEEAPRAKIR